MSYCIVNGADLPGRTGGGKDPRPPRSAGRGPKFVLGGVRDEGAKVKKKRKKKKKKSPELRVRVAG